MILTRRRFLTTLSAVGAAGDGVASVIDPEQMREGSSGPAAKELTRCWRKADSNRRSLPVNELVSQAEMRMRARRLGCS